MSAGTAELTTRALRPAMSFSIKVDPATGQQYMAVSQKGRPLLLHPFTNKGTAFTLGERDELDLGGLVPPAVCNIHQQMDRTYENFKAKTSDLEKFIYLTSLQDRNETLFYRLALEHIDEIMPIVYTPVVGEACQKYHHIYRRGRGLYIAYEDRHRIEAILHNAGIPHPSVIVVTDGERILGLGDQGAGGMGIPIGKLGLYTLCAGVSPYSTLPITLDVGTNNQERLNDPLYLGMRHERVRGAAYQEFIDAFVAAVQKVFPRVVLQWEDFLKENALFQLSRFRDQLCTFNDDIQGTAGVVLAGVYGALRITGQRMRDQRVVFAGAGASAQGISELLVAAFLEDGLSLEEANRRIWTADSRGLVTRERPNLEPYKATYARSVEEVAGYACKDRSRITLLETALNAKATMLIGVSATPGVFDEPVIRAMARINARPIVLPLSNPTSKSEVTPQDALRWSEGRAIVAWPRATRTPRSSSTSRRPSSAACGSPSTCRRDSSRSGPPAIKEESRHGAARGTGGVCCLGFSAGAFIPPDDCHKLFINERLTALPRGGTGLPVTEEDLTGVPLCRVQWRAP